MTCMINTFVHFRFRSICKGQHRKGAFVCTYTGETLSGKEGETRLNNSNGPCYLYFFKAILALKKYGLALTMKLKIMICMINKFVHFRFRSICKGQHRKGAFLCTHTGETLSGKKEGETRLNNTNYPCYLYYFKTNWKSSN